MTLNAGNSASITGINYIIEIENGYFKLQLFLQIVKTTVCFIELVLDFF